MAPVVVPWFRLSATFYKHPKVAALGDDATRWAWVRVLCEAALWNGRFHNGDHLTSSVGVTTEQVERFIAAGLLNGSLDSALAVHDWDEYQRPMTGAERTDKWRRKKRDEQRDEPTSHQRHTLTSHPNVTGVTPTDRHTDIQTDIESDARVRATPEREDDWFTIIEMAEQVTGVPYALNNPHAKIAEMAKQQVASHGIDATRAAWEAAAAASGQHPTIRQVIIGADNALNPIPSMSAGDRSESEREAVVASLKAEAKKKRGTT